MIITKTPLRITFLGGNSDYPDYCKIKNGLTIGTTINKYIYIAYKDSLIRDNYNYKISYFDFERANQIKQLKHPFLKKIFQKYKLNFKLDMNISSDVPASIGLGSSGAFSVGLVKLLDRVTNKKNKQDKDLFISSYEIERSLGNYVGYQDFVYPSFGGFSKVSYKNNKITVSKNYSKKNISLIEKSISLIYLPRLKSTHIVTNHIKKRIVTSKVENLLDRIVEVTKDADKLLKSTNFNLAHFGELIDEYWKLKKNISSKISNNKIEKIISDIQNFDIFGLKLLGAGSGGCICIFSNTRTKKKLKEKYKNNFIDIKFIKNKSKIIEI